MGVLTASIGIIAHPAPANAVDYPTWGDVQQAKANVQTQQAMVDKINALVGQLQEQATAAGIKSEQAVEAYHQAQQQLDDATQKAADLKTQADAAQKTAETSTVRAGLLASHLMRTAGTDGSIGLLLQGGDSGAADKLLYQLGTMSQLTEQSKRVYDQAIADRNTAQSLSEQAKAAQDARQKAADAAQQALQAANDAADAAQAAVATQQQKQTDLTAQLASLQNTSTQVAAQYVAGQQAIAAAKAAAAAQAAAAAAAEKLREQQQQQQQQGKPPSGGGSNGAPPPVTTAPPSASAVQTAINYARAQIGKPYIINGSGPNGYDCSGLTMQAYAAAGIYIGGHGSTWQYQYAAAHGQLVARSNAQPGDLIFWGTAPNDVYHVGIYIGGGQMIAAPQVGENVKQQAVWGAPLAVVARPSIGH
ncbi:NlpC/P60 family protein [Gryllotalpicola protaetiae]|uniref:NlpC/P60 family protein n=2 Tax=Gryllotalpicola protaetiae TaxID=2419771 RepID=A0A387BWS0_9MICO|nr:NlpC/P60 family protein [Gryllotalpicola protaetiae]